MALFGPVVRPMSSALEVFVLLIGMRCFVSDLNFWYPVRIHSSLRDPSTMPSLPSGISLLVDFAFKLAFANPKHSGPLNALLNAILELEVPIVDIEFLNPFKKRIFKMRNSPFWILKHATHTVPYSILRCN